ncbi:MAG: ZIP family metal transporter [Candidatus Bathyarchaeia archaeon]
MLQNLLQALAATITISIISLVGVFIISIDEEKLTRIIFILVGFSAGAILGASLFDLLPEAIELGEELGGELTPFLYITLGFVSFFLLERFIHFNLNYMRKGVKDFAYLNLILDGIHNFLDGLVIAAGFLAGVSVGITSTIAVTFHELPQEIGDFGVLIYGGFKRSQAMTLNFLAACAAIAGTIFAYFFNIYIENFSAFLTAFAAGGFLYLAASELIPELQKEEDYKRAIVQYVLFIAGLAIIWWVGIILHEPH